MLQLAVFASTLAYVFYIIAIKEIGVIKANIFTNLIPVFTGLFSFIILDERFSLLKIAGMILVLGGVIVSQMQRISQNMVNRRRQKRFEAGSLK
jgi:drug/metabolite transporter (DMT)-like permease